MALTGVTRPGHVQLRVLDLAAAKNFYGNVLGLVETGTDAQGRVYYKAWDERDHSSVIIRQADSAGMDFIGYKVLNKAELDRLEAGVKAFGIETRRIPAGELLETGERVRFELPTGHQFELYAEKTLIGNGLEAINPSPWDSRSEHGIAPLRLDHALLYGPNVGKVLELFTQVLGFTLTEYVTLPESDVKGALWLSCSNKAHDIAFVEHANPGKLHHVSYLLESWEKVLRAGDIMSMNQVPVDIGPTRHGITRGTTIYAWDPSGNRFETFCGGTQPYPDWPAVRWNWDGLPQGLDFPQRKLHETFLTVVS